LGFDQSSQVMKILLSDIGIAINPGENTLLESVSLLKSQLAILLKVYLIGSAWRIGFRSVIGLKVLMKGICLNIGPANADASFSGGQWAVSRVHQGGWLNQIWFDPEVQDLIYEGSF
jgi:hypothetical protein